MLHTPFANLTKHYHCFPITKVKKRKIGLTFHNLFSNFVLYNIVLQHNKHVR